MKVRHSLPGSTDRFSVQCWTILFLHGLVCHGRMVRQSPTYEQIRSDTRCLSEVRQTRRSPPDLDYLSRGSRILCTRYKQWIDSTMYQVKIITYFISEPIH